MEGSAAFAAGVPVNIIHRQTSSFLTVFRCCRCCRGVAEEKSFGKISKSRMNTVFEGFVADVAEEIAKLKQKN